jgi:hypothetical protein
MQRDSTKLRTVEDQLSFLPGEKIVSRPVSLDRIYTLSDTHEALVYACELARLQPKQIYPHMGVDKTTWSRICSGEWDLDGRDIKPFSAVVKNDAYLLYLNHVQGFDLASIRKAESDEVAALKAELAAERAENHELRQSLKHVVEAKAGR